MEGKEEGGIEKRGGQKRGRNRGEEGYSRGRRKRRGTGRRR